MWARGVIHCGAYPDGQGDGVLGVERTRLRVDGVPDGGCRPRGLETALRNSAGGVILGPREGQALRGGHDPDWGRCVRPEEPSAHLHHATTDARSKESRVRIPAGGTPFCPPAGRVQQQPPWNPLDGLPGNLQATFQRAPLHALLVSRSYITYEEAMTSFPH